MKTLIPSKKQGSILVIVTVIMVTFSLMVAALLQLGSFSQIETVQQLRNTQAHWLAEAGLERALSWVAASRDYRNGLPSSEPAYSSPWDDLPNGQYQLKVWGPGTTNIVIQSRGTTTGGGVSASAAVELSFSYTPGLPGAIIGLNDGNTDIGVDVRVRDGDVYRNGTMEIRGTVDLDHSVYATDGDVSDGTGPKEGAFTQNYIPEVESPVIDRDGHFAGLLAKAADPLQTTNKIFSGTLSGTVFVNGDLLLNGGISGSGALVVSGNLTLQGVNSTIASDVEVIVGENISIDQQTTFGNNVEIFSQNGNISLNHNISGGAVALIAKNGSLGQIETDYDNTLGVIDEANVLTSGHEIGNIKKDDFLGILYAKYDIILRHKADINGTIIAGRNMDLGKDTGNEFRVTYDPAVFNGAWQLYFQNAIVILNSVWREL